MGAGHTRHPFTRLANGAAFMLTAPAHLPTLSDRMDYDQAVLGLMQTRGSPAR